MPPPKTTPLLCRRRVGWAVADQPHPLPYSCPDPEERCVCYVPACAPALVCDTSVCDFWAHHFLAGVRHSKYVSEHVRRSGVETIHGHTRSKTSLIHPVSATLQVVRQHVPRKIHFFRRFSSTKIFSDLFFKVHEELSLFTKAMEVFVRECHVHPSRWRPFKKPSAVT